MAGIWDEAQDEQRGRGIGGLLGDVAGLPLQALRAYGSAFKEIPRGIADGRARRAAEIETEHQRGEYARQQSEEIAAKLRTEAERRAYIEQNGPAAGLDPLARIGMLLNPDKMGEAIGSNYTAANVNGGDSRVSGFGRPAYTAPKLSMDGGFGVTQTPGLTSVTGERPASIQEGINKQTADQTGQFQEGQLDLRGQELSESERAARAREGIARQQEGRLGGGDGGGGGPRAQTPNMIMGSIQAKIAAGLPLTQGEQQLYGDSRGGGGLFGGDGYGDYGDEEGAPAAAPRPIPSGPAPARPIATRPGPSPRPVASGAASTGLPPAAAASLKEGRSTQFNNGQVWTLRSGKPVQIR